MLTDGKQNESLLPVGYSNLCSEPAVPISLPAVDFPLPPAMPDAVLLLRLLLSSHSADLYAITDVVRNDLGLTIQLFHLAATERHGRATNILDIGNLIVLIGVEKLKALATQSRLNALPMRDAAPCARDQFWRQARRSARICEELAAEIATENREAAYVAGLTHQLGMLPSLLGWGVPAERPERSGEIGYHMAKSWQIPALLADVIRGDATACTSRRAHSLLRLVNLANERGARWNSKATTSPSAWAWA
jgi:HD-like signal output (HDOD) protein